MNTWRKMAGTNLLVLVTLAMMGAGSQAKKPVGKDVDRGDNPPRAAARELVEMDPLPIPHLKGMKYAVVSEDPESGAPFVSCALGKASLRFFDAMGVIKREHPLPMTYGEGRTRHGMRASSNGKFVGLRTSCVRSETGCREDTLTVYDTEGQARWSCKTRYGGLFVAPMGDYAVVTSHMTGTPVYPPAFYGVQGFLNPKSDEYESPAYAEWCWAGTSWDAVLSDDGKRLAVACWDIADPEGKGRCAVVLFDSLGNLTRRIVLPVDALWTMKFTRDTNYLAAVGKDFLGGELPILFFLDAESGQIAWTHLLSKGDYHLAFTENDTQLVAAGMSDPSLYVFNTATGAEEWKYEETEILNFSFCGLVVSGKKIFTSGEERRGKEGSKAKALLFSLSSELVGVMKLPRDEVRGRGHHRIGVWRQPWMFCKSGIRRFAIP